MSSRILRTLRPSGDRGAQSGTLTGISLDAYEEFAEVLLAGDDPEGQIFRARLDNAGATQEWLVDDLGLSKGTVANASLTLDALLADKVPSAFRSARTVRGRLRTFAARHRSRLGDEASQHLVRLEGRCSAVVDGTEAMMETRALKAARDADQPGIYVYTLSHYLRHPISEAPDDSSVARTWLKVGMSSTDAYRRVQQQANTGLPEPPMLLRIYDCPPRKIATQERDIHRVLEAFDHNPNQRSGAGKEWFLTSLDALDELADVVGLKIAFRFEDAADIEVDGVPGELPEGAQRAKPVTDDVRRRIREDLENGLSRRKTAKKHGVTEGVAGGIQYRMTQEA